MLFQVHWARQEQQIFIGGRFDRYLMEMRFMIMVIKVKYSNEDEKVRKGIIMDISLENFHKFKVKGTQIASHNDTKLKWRKNCWDLHEKWHY